MSAEGKLPYQVPRFGGTNATEKLIAEADTTHPHTLHFDLKFTRSREILIFMEESKIWQEQLQNCIDQAGVNASSACLKLHEIVNERIVYYNAQFNAATRPTLSPGIPSLFEKFVAPDTE